MDGQKINNLSLKIPQDPRLKDDPLLKDLERQYHDTLIELHEIVRAYNDLLERLEKK
jgi:hypothetical protein